MVPINLNSLQKEYIINRDSKFIYFENNRSINIEKFEDFFETVERSWNPETVNQNLILGNSCIYKEFQCSSYALLPDRIYK